jgi:hypothetical protein
MAKAAKSSTRTSAVAEDPTADDRINFNGAGELLSKRFPNVHMACTRLDEAIRCAQVRLYAGDHIVSPDFFAGHLRIAVAVDGRLELRPTRAIVGTFVWTVLREDVLNLETGKRNPRNAGVDKKFDRDFMVAEAEAYVRKNGLPSRPGKSPTLDDLVEALQTKLGRKKMAGDTLGKEILRPFFNRVKDALR